MEYPSWILLGIVVALSFLILLICWVHMAGIDRQKAILSGVAGFPVATSDYYKFAYHYITEVQQIKLTKGFTVPILALFGLVAFCSAIAYYSSQWNSYLATPNFILGGAHVFDDRDTLMKYQSGTVLIGTMAFVGAYVYIIQELLSRINNSDITPVTYYFFSCRIVVATMVADVARHILSFLSPAGATDPSLMIFLGFFIGLRPDLGTKFILDKAFKHFGLLGEQSDPDAKTIPNNFSLMLIEGLTEEKRSRLDELSIDNCQALAGHNPFIIWARTSYQLLHIVDWIAQAQLCLLVGPEGIWKLRAIGIRDIFGLEAALKGASAAAVANVLGYPQQLEKDIVNYLVENPAFKRLKQVYKCLCDDPAHNTDKPPISTVPIDLTKLAA